jgi:hypothetical protein
LFGRWFQSALRKNETQSAFILATIDVALYARQHHQSADQCREIRAILHVCFDGRVTGFWFLVSGSLNLRNSALRARFKPSFILANRPLSIATYVFARCAFR